MAMGGTNVANLPLGAPPNQDFVVTDVLPFGITNAVINSVPPTTEVLVNGAPYITGDTIPDGATIIWRGDRADLTPLPSLQIDYIAGAAGVCPVGQTITNTATVDYAACGINNDDSDGFILSESPAGGAITNILVGGDGNFEAGALDSNGVSRDEIREGEQIPFTVTYSFPAGFNGTWAGTRFTAELRSAAGTGVPLVLSNNRTDVHLLITRISDAALICNLDLNPATDFTGGDGSAPLVITDFSAIAGCPTLIPLNMQDHNMILTYSATSPEGDLDGNGDPLNDTNVGGYLEFKEILKEAKTVFLSGPCGVFEKPLFKKGTTEIFNFVANSDAFSIVGGGHTVAAVEQMNLRDKMSHISTGGGSLEKFMMGEKLVVVESLKNAKKE